MQTSSWVIVRKSDQRVIAETWNYKIRDAINTKSYDVYAIEDWLAMHNGKAV